MCLLPGHHLNQKETGARPAQVRAAECSDRIVKPKRDPRKEGQLGQMLLRVEMS